MIEYIIYIFAIIISACCCSALRAQDISVTITPPDSQIVPEAGIQLTADATPANGADGACITFDWSDEDGDWGTGTVTGLESVLSYYPEGDTYGTDDDLTCTVTDGVGDTDMDDVDLYVPLVKTITMESSTQDDSRTTIGIGEEVNLQITPTDLPGPDQTFWTNSGSGQFENNIYSGLNIVYQAYCVAENDTITITFSDGTTNTDTTFNVILPSIFRMPQDTTHPLYPVPAGSYGVTMDLTPYFGPDTVNFYNAWAVEANALSTTTGSWATPAYTNIGHSPGPAASLGTTVNPGWGTGGNGLYDQSMMSIHLSDRPYQNNSTFTWNIPEKWDWSNNFGGNTGGGTSASGVEGTITNAVAKAVISVSGGNTGTATMSETKYTDGAQATASSISNKP